MSSVAVSVLLAVPGSLPVVAVFSVPLRHVTLPRPSGTSNGLVGMSMRCMVDTTREARKKSFQSCDAMPVGTSSSPVPLPVEVSALIAAFRSSLAGCAFAPPITGA